MVLVEVMFHEKKLLFVIPVQAYNRPEQFYYGHSDYQLVILATILSRTVTGLRQHDQWDFL